MKRHHVALSSVVVLSSLLGLLIACSSLPVEDVRSPTVDPTAVPTTAPTAVVTTVAPGPTVQPAPPPSQIKGEWFKITTADGLPSDEIRDVQIPVIKSEPYEVWVATSDGVGHWDGQQWVVYTTAHGLPSNNVRGIAPAQPGTVWAATDGGAAYFDGQFWNAFTHKEGLPEGELKGVVYRSFGPDDMEVWFSTRGSGLFVFRFQSLTP